MGQFSLVHRGGGGARNRRRALRIPEARDEVVRRAIGWAFPAVAGALTVAVAQRATPPVAHGVAVGTALAVVQAYLSIAALRWSWNRPWFWQVWGGGVLCRMVIFAATAFVVFRYTQLNFVATMASMVAATTVFIVVEAATCLKG